MSRNTTERRSLCFNPELTPASTYFMYTSKSPKFKLGKPQNAGKGKGFIVWGE